MKMALDGGWGGITQQIEPRRLLPALGQPRRRESGRAVADAVVLRQQREQQNTTHNDNRTRHKRGERWEMRAAPHSADDDNARGGRMGEDGKTQGDLVPVWVKAG